MKNTKNIKIYGCYGSNLNKKQMAFRCPDAKSLGYVILEDYELSFDRVATIIKKKGAKVPLGLWAISERDEKSLDKYEGFPNYYYKKYFEIEFKDEKLNVMVYIKSYNEKGGTPSESYFNIINEGYSDFNIDKAPLLAAVKSLNKK